MLSAKWISFLLFQFCTSAAAPAATTPPSPTHTLIPNESITDGQIVVSNGSNFALGFFSPGNSSNRYVGIWYHNIPDTTVVWVANRDNPLYDSSGVLSFALDGNFFVSSRSDQKRRPLWSTNVSINSNTTTFLKLLNSGNLVLYSGDGGGTNNPNSILWQSFDHPTHTHLPGMKLGFDWRTGLNRVLTSWRSKDDPGRGIYSYGIDPEGSPQLFLYKVSAKIWRSGPWNGRTLSGVPQMNQAYIFRYDFVSTTDELYLIYVMHNSIISTFVLNDSGHIQRMMWVAMKSRWNILFSAPSDVCEDYGHCGVNGICNSANTVECTCLPNFQPKSPGDWYLSEWSDGCVRQRSVGCGKGDGFLKLVGVKLPDTSMSRVDKSLSLNECEQECLKNCSCTAYATADINGGGSGCVAWFGNLMDIRYFIFGGQDLYLRVDAVELALAAQARKDKGFLHNKRIVVISTVSLVVGVLVFAACVNFLLKRRKGKEKKGKKKRHFSNVNFAKSGTIEEQQRVRKRIGFLFDLKNNSTSYKNSPRPNDLEDDGRNPELPFIEFDAIATATDYFSSNNKLGEGGFGAVYKGRLLNGKEIAVKRLSKNSGQGMEEFKNEVVLIAKLQHRNLVRLLACSLQEEEKMLIYEYMLNKSLDFFIFDESRRALLNWRKRFEIIVGIARGVLYLHQDSRLRIIHRDLKASNVLLDEEMNPKISDFGMARIFGGSQIQANTKKVVGTYGYMSPEYAMHGIFSIKSDVFSFGVLLLEIISGKKNNDYFEDDPFVNLIGHVWNLWKEGIVLEIVDPSIGDSFVGDEVSRCIQVGLLCVQESAAERPTMSSVIFMLGNETNMPLPNQPAFIFPRTLNVPIPSINDVTITMEEPR